MEMKTITTDRCIRICDERAVLEGDIAIPYEGTEVSTVLEICGCAEVTSTTAEAERVIVSGKARYTILYLTRSGAIDSFDSECGFEHIIEVEGVVPGIRICANVHTLGTSWRIENGRISVRSELSVNLLAAIPEEYEIALPDEDDDIQCDRINGEVIVCGTKNIKAYVNQDIRVPQNLPEAQKILAVYAQAELISLQKEPGQIIAEGTLHVGIFYESTDQNAPLQFFREEIPFGEMIKEPACNEDSLIFADVSVDRIDAELTSGDTAAVTGVVSISAMCINRRSQEFVRDAYSLTQEVHAEQQNIAVCYPFMQDSMRKTVRIETEIPESAPEAARILCASSRPEITGIIENEQIGIDGILYLTLIYTTAESGIKSIHLREPFELELGRGEGIAEVRIFSEQTSAQGTGRKIDVKINMQICLCGKKDASVTAITNAKLTEREQDSESGVFVYFADDGEKLWDICKRWSVRQDSAIPVDSPEPLHCGDRVIVVK